MKHKLLWPLALMLVFALSRWPRLMPLNFSATYALVFCAGLYFPPRLAWLLPLGTLAVSDVLISAFYYHTSWTEFFAALGPNYLGYAALIGLGRLFGPKRSWASLVGGSLLGAILFYIITNTAAWMTLGYAKTLPGWIQALTTGLPGYPPTWQFFRNTLLSSGLFSALFIGSMKAVESSSESAQEKEEAEPEKEEGKAEEAV